MGRRLKRQKGEKGNGADKENKNADKLSSREPLTPEGLGNAVNPFKRIFPWDFPGQNGDWIKKGRNK